MGEEREAKDFQRAGCGVFLSLLNVPADPGKDFFAGGLHLTSEYDW